MNAKGANIMTMFKCKMCGGDLEIIEGATTAECEYCGTKQTVPKAMDENLQNLFNRANTLRIKSEFDKAEKLMLNGLSEKELEASLSSRPIVRLSFCIKWLYFGCGGISILAFVFA